MSKGLFITGTDTDIGKTYVTALLVKTMRQNGYDTGYYKAAISGAPTVAASDAGFVNEFAGIHEPEDMLLSYLYQHAVSPHLAARLEGHPLEKDVILAAWKRVTEAYPYVTMEGSATMRRRCTIWRISFPGCICRCLSSRMRGWGRSIMW